ncbi:prohibitin family protein [Hathewaya histolytica]|uniref:Spfh domain / band 7 family protein n=1 Tax=Hathewaya histolytica TaxID=1498 RepID=A0A4U9RB98_HATHI|nr:prohibitin family protein [Hathewaya histolytica]VTQ88952.1 spfh domain / band 7 family protein [Hathewaya histolytica]
MKSKRLGAIVSAVVIGFCVIIGVKSAEIIKPGYVGIVYSMNGGVQNKVLTQGLKFTSPIKSVKQYSVATEQAFLSKDKREGSEDDDSFIIPTKDGKTVNVDLEFAYHFDSEKLPKTFTRFKGQSGKDIEKTFIRGKMKSWASEVSSNFSVIDIYGEQRGRLNKEMLEYSKKKFDEYGIVIDSVNFPRIGLDNETEKAIQNRINSQQKLEQSKIERDKSKIEAEKKKIEAQADADAKLIKANSEAQANKKLQESLTPTIVEYKKIEKWDGKMPQVQGGNAILDMKK